MTDRQDPELIAIGVVLRALNGLDRMTQRRILSYVSEKLRADVKFETEALVVSLSEGLNAINEAAARLNEQQGEDVSGLTLVSVISKMYEQAAEHVG